MTTSDVPLPIISTASMVLRPRDAALLTLIMRRGLRDARAEGWQLSPGHRQLLAQIETLAAAHREQSRQTVAELDVTDVTADHVTRPTLAQVTTTSAALRLQIGEPAVRKMIRTGRLPASKIRGSWVIDPEDLNQELERRRAS